MNGVCWQKQSESALTTCINVYIDSLFVHKISNIPNFAHISKEQ